MCVCVCVCVEFARGFLAAARQAVAGGGRPGGGRRRQAAGGRRRLRLRVCMCASLLIGVYARMVLEAYKCEWQLT